MEKKTSINLKRSHYLPHIYIIIIIYGKFRGYYLQEIIIFIYIYNKL